MNYIQNRIKYLLKNIIEELNLEDLCDFDINVDGLDDTLQGAIIELFYDHFPTEPSFFTRRMKQGVQNAVEERLGLEVKVVISIQPCSPKTIENKIDESEVKEISQLRGHMDIDPMHYFFQTVYEDFEKQGIDYRKVFDEYFGDILGFNTSKVSEDDFNEYLLFLGGSAKPAKMRNYTTYATVTEFAFFIADNFYELKSGGFGLSYILKEHGEFKYNKIFEFFDPIFAIYIGSIEVKSNRRNGVYKVLSSGVEKKLIGLGYGTKMYLSILDNCEYLKSDSLLYEGSMRIWKASLPKYVNVWWVIEEGFGDNKILDFGKVEPNKPLNVNLHNVTRFIASSKKDKLSKKVKL